MSPLVNGGMDGRLGRGGPRWWADGPRGHVGSGWADGPRGQVGFMVARGGQGPHTERAGDAGGEWARANPAGPRRHPGRGGCRAGGHGRLGDDRGGRQEGTGNGGGLFVI